MALTNHITLEKGLFGGSTAFAIHRFVGPIGTDEIIPLVTPTMSSDKGRTIS
ncbi:MAG: hypothetical protein ACE5HN_01570 [Nitrospiria bacterium]